MIASADLDKSGNLDFGEFRQLMRQTFSEGPGVRISNKKLIQTAMLTAMSDELCGAEMSEKQIQRMFHIIDKDGDGRLSEDELKVFLKGLGLNPAVINGFIVEVGRESGTTLLDFGAFSRMCRALFHGDAEITLKTEQGINKYAEDSPT